MSVKLHLHKSPLKTKHGKVHLYVIQCPDWK